VKVVVTHPVPPPAIDLLEEGGYEVVEHTFALILAVARRIVEGDRIVRERRFHRWGPSFLLGMELHGKTIAVVGPGRIGETVARIAECGFGMRVLRVGRGPLLAVLPRADVVTLHVPLTPETHHLISARELAAMKPEAILVNTSRGPVVDERALVEALHARQIGGAALDVSMNVSPTSPKG
jgi:glyoxylate reductase